VVKTIEEIYTPSTKVKEIEYGNKKQELPTYAIELDPEWNKEQHYLNFSKHLRAEGSLNLPEFFSLQTKTIQAARPNLKLVPAYPKELMVSSEGKSSILFNTDDKEYTDPGSSDYTLSDIPDENNKFNNIITYKVIKKVPSGAGEPFSNTRRIWKHRVMESNLTDPYSDKHRIQIMAKEFDCMIQYDVFAKTNYEVEYLADWFENFMHEFSGFFKLKGIMEMFFWDYHSSDVEPGLRVDIPKRTIMWYIKIQDIRQIRHRIWEKFNVQLVDVK